MTLHRVFAMARPRRPACERVAVIAAAAALAPGASARAKAKAVASAVITELLEDAERCDPFDRAMFEARQAIAHDPVVAIVADAQIDLAGMLRRERLIEFEARGCVQLGPAEWERETLAICARLTARLEARYRKLFS